MHENEVARIVVDAAYHKHRELGPGLLESVYEKILAFELRNRGLYVESQVAIPVTWKSLQLETAFRADMIVERTVVLELKSVDEVAKVHKKQMLTYLKVSNRRLGLLINFGAPYIRDGIERIINGKLE